MKYIYLTYSLFFGLFIDKTTLNILKSLMDDIRSEHQTIINLIHEYVDNIGGDVYSGVFGLNVNAKIRNTNAKIDFYNEHKIWYQMKYPIINNWN